LFLTGWIDAAGKFDRSRSNPLITVEGRNARYTIVTANESGTGKAIAISEIDIENIIRTKAAIYTACALMLEQVQMDFSDLAPHLHCGRVRAIPGYRESDPHRLDPDVPRDKFFYSAIRR
jgi:uncharacterized 2Fe-2S/4Fe-4S cluster protein (DUF4445 family)